MKYRSILIGLVLALAAPGASGLTMNSAGTVCQPKFPADDGPKVYYANGRVGTTGFANVECAVPRAAGGVAMTVYVDFFFVSGTQTGECEIIVYDRDGNPQTSTNVTKTGTLWQRASASFTAAQNPAWAYTSVDCELATTSHQILGVTAAY